MIFNSVAIEVTRRCNMACAHCIRGDAQNLDITAEAIDNLALNATGFGLIEFTGGEPTLNVPAILHTLTACKKHKIPVRQIRVTTNGLLHSVELADVLKLWAEYIVPEWRYDGLSPVVLDISKDRYHVGVNPYEAESFYWRALYNGELHAPCATIELIEEGDHPVAWGRAKDLPEAIRIMRPLGNAAHSIALWEYGKPCECPEPRDVKAPTEGETVVCCTMFLQANGDVIRAHHMTTFDNDDEVIINLNTKGDILTAIRQYNERIPRPCAEALVEEQKASMARMMFNIDGYMREYKRVATQADIQKLKDELDIKKTIRELAELFQGRG